MNTFNKGNHKCLEVCLVMWLCSKLLVVTQVLRISWELPTLLAEIFSFPCYWSTHPGALVTMLSLSYRLPALTHERLYCLSLHPLHLISGLQ